MNRVLLIEKLIQLGLEPKQAREFVAYHQNNPQIWQAFRAYTEALLRRGKQHFGAKAIWEHLRYETALRGGKDYKLNNNYHSAYARLFAIATGKTNFFNYRQKERSTSGGLNHATR